jgi:hypothetical protein
LRSLPSGRVITGMSFLCSFFRSSGLVEPRLYGGFGDPGKNGALSTSFRLIGGRQETAPVSLSW